MTSAIQTLQSHLIKATHCATCNKHVDDVKIHQSTSALTIQLNFFCHGDIEIRNIDTHMLFFAKSAEDSITTLMKMVPTTVFIPAPKYNYGAINDYFEAQVDGAPESELIKLKQQIADTQAKLAQPSFIVTDVDHQSGTNPLSDQPWWNQPQKKEPPQKQLSRFEMILQKEESMP